jgi:hypothetical protein
MRLAAHKLPIATKFLTRRDQEAVMIVGQAGNGEQDHSGPTATKMATDVDLPEGPGADSNFDDPAQRKQVDPGDEA